VLAAIDAGADVIELGVPFSDPVADGPVIQRASERALRRNVTLGSILRLAASIREKRPDAGLIVFSYFNPILRYGLARFANDAAAAGVNGALITDLTVEESAGYLRHMRRRRLATVFLAAPTSTDARLRAIARASRGFVYAVSRTGVTGAHKQMAGDARNLVRRMRRFTKLPIALGFGISTPAQFREAGRFADAVVVGSAIVQTIERAGRRKAARAVAELVAKMKKQ
jgi:tryptophan synthase alpha chain